MTKRFRSRRFQFEWLMLYAALLLIGGVIGYSLFDEHQRLDATERERLQTQARVIDDNVGRELAAIDRALSVIAADARYWREGDAAHDRLKDLADVVAGVRGLLILDADGRVTAASREPMLGRNMSQQEYFRSPFRHRDPKIVHVSSPFTTPLGLLGVGVSKAIVDDGSHFSGVVAAILDAEHFNALLESLRYAPDMWISLAQGDGKLKLYMLVPTRPEFRSMELAPPGSFFARHRDSGQKASLQGGIADAGGEESIAAVRTIKPAGLPMDKPLVVAVGRSVRAIHAGRLGDALKEVGLFVMLALASVFGLHRHQRRQRHADAVAAANTAERRQAAERLRLATEAAHLGVWEYDLVRDRLTWDASMFSIYGADPATFSGDYRAWRDAVLPEDLPAAEAFVKSVVVDGVTYDSSFRIRRGDGQVRMLSVRAAAINDEDGRPAKFVGINEDITERWRAEEAIRESEERFRLMADSAPVLIWVSGPTRARSYFNRSWLEFTGRTIEAEAGLGWTDGIHPDDREAVERICDHGDGQPTAFMVEYRLRRHDGAYRWVLEHGAPRLDADGDLLGFIGSCVDIDERRRAEAELRKLSKAIEQAATPVIITDASGTIEYVNPGACRAYGYADRELIGENPRILQSDSTPREVYREMWETILAGETWRGELTNRRSDGTLIDEAVTVSPIRDEAGRITHFVAIKEDVSAQRHAESMRRELQARLGKLERMELLGSLAGGIAHDFNNILVAILGFSSLGQTVLRAAGGPPRVVGFFEEIEIAGERAKALVQQLLTFSRGGRMAVEPVRFADVAHEVVALLRVTFPATVRLATEVDADLPPLTADPSQLHQLLVNLCVNARDAMDRPGTVVISARLARVDVPLVCASCHREFAGEFFRVAVRDEGPGIPEAVRDRIFEPFFTTKEVGRGTGMGLAVVHGIAHLYGGHIQVDSTAGAGAEIAVYLPRVVPGLTATDDAIAAAAPAAGT